MKHIYSIIFSFLFISLSLTSYSQKKTAMGRLFQYNGDTIVVKIKIPTITFSKEVDYEKIQYRLKYISDDGNTYKVSPHYTKEVRFKYRGESFRLVSCNTISGVGAMRSEKLFLQLEIDGKAKAYRFFKKETAYSATMNGMPAGGRTYIESKIVLQKGDEELYLPKGINFRKKTAQYFSDCPTLYEKIMDREYAIENLVSIVLYYNGKCK